MFEMDDIKMCSKCDYNWTKYEWEHGKGRVAFSHPSDYIEEGEVVCSMCYKGVDEYFPEVWGMDMKWGTGKYKYGLIEDADKHGYEYQDDANNTEKENEENK